MARHAKLSVRRIGRRGRVLGSLMCAVWHSGFNSKLLSVEVTELVIMLFVFSQRLFPFSDDPYIFFRLPNLSRTGVSERIRARRRWKIRSVFFSVGFVSFAYSFFLFSVQSLSPGNLLIDAWSSIWLSGAKAGRYFGDRVPQREPWNQAGEIPGGNERYPDRILGPIVS